MNNGQSDSEKLASQQARNANAASNAAKLVAAAAPGAVGTAAKGAVIADKVTNGALSRAAGGALSRVPGGNTLGSLAGNKLATGAANMASAKNSNPSEDGFSGIKGKDSLEKSSKNNYENKVESSISSEVDSNKKNDDYLGSNFFKSIFGDNSLFESLFGANSPLKSCLLVIILFAVAFTIFIGVFASINEKEQNSKALAVSVISVSAVKPDGNPLGGAPGLLVASSVADVIDLVSNKIDFKIFNKEKPLVDDEGIATSRDSSAFGDYLSSLNGKYPEKFVKAFFNLGSIFGSGSSGCSDSECTSNPEVAFYQKVADISYRYKKLYNIELDWPLITSTIIVNQSDKDLIFAENLNSYTVKELNNLKKTMSLDWEYNYKKIPDYDYLSGNDSRYDLQILAKNMVTKKTTQTCSSGSNVTKKTELVDIEDSLIEEEEDLVKQTDASKRKDLELQYYLLCGANEKYSISSIYTLDKEKYDEFLSEFLEMKYFVNKNGQASGTYDYEPLPHGTDLASTMVAVATSQIGIKGNEASKYWSPYFSQKVGWCGCFVTWVLKNTEYNGVHLYSDVIKQTSYPGSPEAYMKYFYDSNDSNIQFHYNGNASRWSSYGPKYTPKPGDLIFFNWYGTWSGNMSEIIPGSGKTSHIGIVKSVSGSTIYTIEGNTGHSEVKEQVRNLNSNDVIGFGSWY